MRNFLPILALLLLCPAASGELIEPRVRNPFWPQGFQRRRYPISETPRYPSEPAPSLTNAAKEADGASSTASTKRTAPVSSTANSTEDLLWHDARATLRFGDVYTFEQAGIKRQSMKINNRLYETGDLISISYGPRRFTWRIQGIDTNNIIRLVRMHHRELSNKELNK